MTLFFLRELESRNYREQSFHVENWATKIAELMESPRRMLHTVQIAAALPLPKHASEQQSALELALCLLPSQSLWPNRPRPRPDTVVDDQREYWAAVEPLLQALMSQPDIDPLGRVGAYLRKIVDTGKTPLAVVAMHLGRTELLARCVDTLPQEYRHEAVLGCGKFGQIALAEKLLSHWDPAQVQGKQIAQDALWMHLSMRRTAAGAPLPSFDPPRAWWNKAISRMTEIAAADRMLRERPHLAVELTAGLLRSDNSSHTVQLAVRHDLDAKQVWYSNQGWQAPAAAVMLGAWAHGAQWDLHQSQRLQHLRHRLNVLHGALGEKEGAQSDWWEVVSALLSAPTIPMSLSWRNAPPDVQTLLDIAQRSKVLLLQGANGLPAPTLLRPVFCALETTCQREHLKNAPDVFLDCALPFARALGQQANAATLTHETAQVYVQAMDAILGDWKNNLLADPPALLEAILWRMALIRQAAHKQHGGKVFPSLGGDVREWWGRAQELIANGAVPSWSRGDASCFHALVAPDQKLPPAIRMLAEAEALRSGMPLASTRPRRI